MCQHEKKFSWFETSCSYESTLLLPRVSQVGPVTFEAIQQTWGIDPWFYNKEILEINTTLVDIGFTAHWPGLAACWHVRICWKVLAQIWWKLHHGQEQERWDLNLQNTFGCFFSISDAKNIPKILNVSHFWYRWPFFLHFSCRISIFKWGIGGWSCSLLATQMWQSRFTEKELSAKRDLV